MTKILYDTIEFTGMKYYRDYVYGKITTKEYSKTKAQTIHKRCIEKFLFVPTHINGRWKWLEKCRILQQYKGLYWKNIKFVEMEKEK
jgi:hypothetical protein